MTSIADSSAPGDPDELAGFSLARRDPLGPVLALGARELPIGAAIGIVMALLVHGSALLVAGLALWEISNFARTVKGQVESNLMVQYDVDLTQPEEREQPEPEPPPPPEEREDPTPVAADQKPSDNPYDDPPPAAAEAGKVLTAEADPDAPIDLTGEGFVNGSGDRYAGGTTAASGTSKTAVRDRRAKPGGVPGGTGTADKAAPPPQGKDLSKAARPTSMQWNCGFPAEADMEQIDYATVMLVVTVGPDGRAKSVSVTSDPGHGFGRQARQCAMRMSYNPGLDRSGQPTTRTTPPFPVRFTR